MNDSLPIAAPQTFQEWKASSSSLTEQLLADSLEIRPAGTDHLPFTYLPEQPDILGELLFGVLFTALLAFIRIRGRNLVSHLGRIALHPKRAEYILSEGIFSLLPYLLLALALSASVVGLAASYALTGEFLTLDALVCTAGLLGLHFLLLAVAALTGWTFNARQAAAEISVSLWSFHILGGLLASPFVIAMFFVHEPALIPMLKTVICLLGFLYLAKIIRLATILISHKVFILYMILYLCAFEIMPLLVFLRTMA